MAYDLDLETFWIVRLFGIPLWPLTIIGGLIVASFAFSMLLRFFRGLSTRMHPFEKFSELGSWAVVTGASDGIGQAYAEQLAKKGMNVFLISRSEARVEAAAKEIMRAYPKVQTRWMAADFSKVDVYERIESELKGLDIGVLINNVGQACDDIQYFWETSTEFVQSMLNVNLISMVRMTHIVMPRMAAKNKGLIVNVASVAGQLPPYIFVMYGSTKNYMKHFSYGLQLECKTACPGVIVQDLSPWFVATKLARLKGQGNLFVPDPSSYVAGALKTVGLKCTHGNLSHEMQGLFVSLIPQWLLLPIMTMVMNGLRRLAIHNKGIEAKQAALGKKD